jgi:hypothetical protein
MLKWLCVVSLVACGGGGDPPADGPAPDVAPSSARVIYLNRDGGSYTKGFPDNSSTNVSNVLIENQLMLPAPTVDEAEWTAFVTCVTSKFSTYNVTVTETDPGVEVHSELAVLNTPDQLGLPGTPIVALPSQGACAGSFGSLVPRAINFLVWDQAGATARCQVATQALAISFGADTVAGCTDVMTAASTCANYDALSFTDAEVACADPVGPPRECRCGLATQNSHALMFLRLGPAM